MWYGSWQKPSRSSQRGVRSKQRECQNDLKTFVEDQYFSLSWKTRADRQGVFPKSAQGLPVISKNECQEDLTIFRKTSSCGNRQLKDNRQTWRFLWKIPKSKEARILTEAFSIQSMMSTESTRRLLKQPGDLSSRIQPNGGQKIEASAENFCNDSRQRDGGSVVMTS